MASIFDNETYESLEKRLQAVSDQAPNAGLVKAASLFYKGDHFQNGDQWVGPRPEGADGMPDGKLLLEIRRGFISANKIKSGVDRHLAAVLGREPYWSIALRRALGTVTNEQGEEVDEEPKPEEQSLIDEADNALVNWWDVRKVLLTLWQGGVNLQNGGRGPLRHFVPRAKLKVDTVTGVIGTPEAKTPDDALKLLYFQAPPPESAAVVTDDETQEQIGIYRRKDGDKTVLEVSYVDEDTQETVLAVYNSEQDAPLYSVRLPLGGRLPIYQMDKEPLVSTQVMQNNALLNMALTMLARNVVLAGFLERVLLNTQLPGEWVEDPAAPSKLRFQPYDLQTGGGAANNYIGVTWQDPKTGEVHVMDPDVRWRDPVDVKTFEDTARIAYINILSEMHQLHELITGDAVASGESRKQALVDFSISVAPTKAEIDAAGRWMLETALAMAAHFMGQPGRYDSLRVNFDSQIYVGELSAEDRRLIMEEVEKRLRPRRDAMSKLGIDDPDAAISEIDADAPPVTTAPAQPPTVPQPAAA